MVDLVGHLAMGLLWVLPVWLLWDDRLSVAFVGLALVGVLVPDVDAVLPVAANGPTHSLAFVVTMALVLGAAIAVTAERALTRWWFEDEGRLPSRTTIYVFAAGGLFVGGVSHLVAHLLSSTTAAEGVALLWPVTTRRLSTANIHSFGDATWNGVLLVVALAMHVGLFVIDRR